MNLFKAITDWPEFWANLNEIGFDAVVYFVIAGASTLLLILKFGLMLLGFGGDELDVDVDIDIDADVHAGDISGHSFTLFSILSLLAFFTGFGWMGLICRVDWGFSGIGSGIAATGFGGFMMFFSSGLLYMTKRLNQQINYDVKTAIGNTGRVYLAIPAKGEGAGQVQVTISGRKKIMSAVSEGPAIDSFAAVTIVETRDDETLIVKPVDAT